MRARLALFLAASNTGAARAQNDMPTDGDMSTVFGSNTPEPSQPAPTGETNLSAGKNSQGDAVTKRGDSIKRQAARNPHRGTSVGHDLECRPRPRS